MGNLDASIIIPTYNRRAFLLELLNDLSRQRLPRGHFEVIVVDDGSTDGSDQIIEETFPFPFFYLRQSNQGSAVARNTGAKLSKGQVLIFLDDDMSVNFSFVAGLVSEHQNYDRIVAMATELRYEPPVSSAYARMSTQGVAERSARQSGKYVQFTECVTNNLSVERDAFFEIGLMQDIAADGPTWWGDVDFGYRASALGYLFRRSSVASCIHRDYSTHNLSSASTRYFKAAQMAVLLDQKHPYILHYLPMFKDKQPVDWRHDSLRLITRKVVRKFASSQLFISLMENLARKIESRAPEHSLLGNLYLWILGGYMYRGFNSGLRKYGPVDSHD